MAAIAVRDYLERPMAPPDAATLDPIDSGSIAPDQALALSGLERLLEPVPPGAPTGWCTLPDGVGYVAVETPMPGVDGQMVDWWFDWHQRSPERYRIWHPTAHKGVSWRPPPALGAKAHWNATHYPVEDLGLGEVAVRIDFCRPGAIGFADDHLSDPRVATIVCGLAGDRRRRVRHTAMVHAFVADDRGVTLRSRFWLGASLRPYLPGSLAGPAQWALTRPAVRRRALPVRAPQLLARHCAEEYANLAALLPELYRDFGPGAGRADG
jgi:hypothetical protein